MDIDGFMLKLNEMGIGALVVENRLEIPIWKTLPAKTPSGATWDKIFNPESKMVIQLTVAPNIHEASWSFSLVSDIVKNLVGENVFMLMVDFTKGDARYVDGKLSIVSFMSESYLFDSFEKRIQEVMVAFPNLLSRFSDPGWFYAQKKMRSVSRKGG